MFISFYLQGQKKLEKKGEMQTDVQECDRCWWSLCSCWEVFCYQPASGQLEVPRVPWIQYDETHSDQQGKTDSNKTVPVYISSCLGIGLVSALVSFEPVLKLPVSERDN